MGEPARKLQPEDDHSPRHVPVEGRGRILRLRTAEVTLTDDEQWLLLAIMDCYCCR